MVPNPFAHEEEKTWIINPLYGRQLQIKRVGREEAVKLKNDLVDEMWFSCLLFKPFLSREV